MSDKELQQDHYQGDQVVVAVSRTIVLGREQEYEAWVSKIAKLATQFQGYMGANIFRPSQGSRKYTTVYRFDDHKNAAAWQTSSEHMNAIAEISSIVEGEDIRQVMSGLEVWFDQQDKISPQPYPARWKMSTVLFCVVFLLLNTLLSVLAPVIGSWPKLLQTAVVVGMQVILMTYVIMPRINLLLAKWLYK